jgi:IMP dehydrogenase/GMP reductase
MSRFIPSGPAMLRIQAEALTYDDVSLVPAHSTVLPKDVSLATRLTRDLRLNLPIVSAAMDTVTEARLAVAMAQLGGIGIIHKNLTWQQQAAEVAKVKKFEAGARHHHRRSPQAHPRPQHFRRAGGRWQRSAGRHRHRARHALRDEAR